MVAAIGVIGAVRPYLKVANYTAYAAVMTPLITMLNELGQEMSGSVLRERAVDTLIGCGIGVVIGYLPFRGSPSAFERTMGSVSRASERRRTRTPAGS